MKIDADEPRKWRELTDSEKGALLLADHERKEIQFLDCDGVWKSEVPNWIPSTAYRVKPKPVVEPVTLHIRRNYLITYDLVDGEPDCSSIKMERIND